MQDHSFHSCFTEKNKNSFEIELGKKTLANLLPQFARHLTERVSQENEKIDGPGAESALLLFQ